MKKRIVNYILIGFISIILFPLISNATPVIPENSKIELGGKTYTSVFKNYVLGDNVDKDYYTISGIISPKKMVIYKDYQGDEEFLIFENGVYRETNATPTEIMDADIIGWQFVEDGYYLDNYIDDEGNQKLGIFYSDPFVRTNFDHTSCYIMNRDVTAVEGKDYYSFGKLSLNADLVSSFNPDEAHSYYVEVDCSEYKEVLIRNLTVEEEETVTSLIRSDQNEYADDNEDVYVQANVVKSKDDFVIINTIKYRNDGASVYNTFNKIYNFSGTKLAELEGNGAFHYLKKSNLYYAATSTHFRIYDANFKIIFSELKTNLPVDENEDYYVASYNYDNNSVYFDFMNGYYMLLTRYEVKEGDNQKYTGKDLTIKFSGELDLLQKVTVNNQILDSKYYTKTSGSTIITLSKDYLSSLSNGTYTLKVSYEDGGEASSTFIIDNHNPLVNPNTADNIITTVIIGSVSLLGLLGYSFIKRRITKVN